MTTTQDFDINETIKEDMNAYHREMALKHLIRMTKELRKSLSYQTAIMKTFVFFWAGSEYSQAIDAANRVDDDGKTTNQVMRIMHHQFGKYNGQMGV